MALFSYRIVLHREGSSLKRSFEPDAVEQISLKNVGKM